MYRAVLLVRYLLEFVVGGANEANSSAEVGEGDTLKDQEYSFHLPLWEEWINGFHSIVFHLPKLKSVISYLGLSGHLDLT